MRIILLRLLWVVFYPAVAVLTTVVFFSAILLYLLGVVLPLWVADMEVPERVEDRTGRSLDWLVGWGPLYSMWWYARLVPRSKKG